MQALRIGSSQCDLGVLAALQANESSNSVLLVLGGAFGRAYRHRHVLYVHGAIVTLATARLPA